ncbi:MAG: type I-E CRISPR-associated protein Cas6/Cse3/CasE [Porticoccaceae bacterium]
MSVDILAYASVLRLSRADLNALKIKDAYGLHRVVYGLFEETRSEAEKQASIPSGIVYADKGGDFHCRQVLMLSDRRPHQTPQFGAVKTKPVPGSFLDQPCYAFEVTLNPGKRDKQTGKIVPMRRREEVVDWFLARAEKSWGFRVNPENLQTEKIGVQVFAKGGRTITHGSATLKGELHVIDPVRFRRSFLQGIGRGRAFGFGLLQIVPFSEN